MRPLSSLDPDEARRIRGVLFDLDDTLLSHGVLTPKAYEALWALQRAGLVLIAVTGRPSGWGEVLVRQWPIAAAVTENGAIQIVRENRSILRIDPCTESERRSRRIRLASLVARVSELVPEARLADDVDARRSDVTWDVGERVRLPEDRIALIVSEIARSCARTTRSSVHVHATFDVADKAQGAIAVLVDRFAEDAGAALHRYAFVGDSGNDAACFAAFRTTFGVANVLPYLSSFTVAPRYVASQPMGEGFAEIARALLAVRR